jgi:hypothetical protein
LRDAYEDASGVSGVQVERMRLGIGRLLTAALDLLATAAEDA